MIFPALQCFTAFRLHDGKLACCANPLNYDLRELATSI